jgi:hypothetical protein
VDIGIDVGIYLGIELKARREKQLARSAMARWEAADKRKLA